MKKFHLDYLFSFFCIDFYLFDVLGKECQRFCSENKLIAKCECLFPPLETRTRLDGNIVSIQLVKLFFI